MFEARAAYLRRLSTTCALAVGQHEGQRCHRSGLPARLASALGAPARCCDPATGARPGEGCHDPSGALREPPVSSSKPAGSCATLGPQAIAAWELVPQSAASLGAAFAGGLRALACQRQEQKVVATRWLGLLRPLRLPFRWPAKSGCPAPLAWVAHIARISACLQVSRESAG